MCGDEGRLWNSGHRQQGGATICEVRPSREPAVLPCGRAGSCPRCCQTAAPLKKSFSCLHSHLAPTQVHESSMQPCEAQRHSLIVQAGVDQLKLIDQMVACSVVQPGPHLLAETA